MYSRRFYGGDRTQRSRVAPAPQTAVERVEPIKKTVEPSVSEALPIMALDIPVIEERNIDFKYFDPKDFLPKALESVSYGSLDERAQSLQVSAYPEEATELPEFTEAENNSSENAPVKEESADTRGDVAYSVRNMTFEDMVLTGLLMLGSSGEYDDDIMLILGLILMIGA